MVKPDAKSMGGWHGMKPPIPLRPLTTIAGDGRGRGVIHVPGRLRPRSCRVVVTADVTRFAVLWRPLIMAVDAWGGTAVTSGRPPSLGRLLDSDQFGQLVELAGGVPDAAGELEVVHVVFVLDEPAGLLDVLMAVELLELLGDRLADLPVVFGVLEADEAAEVHGERVEVDEDVDVAIPFGEEVDAGQDGLGHDFLDVLDDGLDVLLGGFVSHVVELVADFREAGGHTVGGFGGGDHDVLLGGRVVFCNT